MQEQSPSNPIAVLIRACGFTFQDPNITAENFPCVNAEPGQVEIVSIKARLMKLGRQWLPTAEVLAYLAELGYRPATLLELVMWWLANPAKHADCLVVAMGQVWRGGAPCVRGFDGFRYLYLVSAENTWVGGCEFVVVRK